MRKNQALLVNNYPSKEDKLWHNTIQFFNTFTIPMLRSIAKTFVLTASHYSPPGKRGKQLGTAAIDSKYYYCKIVDLLASQKDPNVRKRPRKEDYKYIRQGYKFKVIRNKYRQKSQTIGYAKSLRTAKRMARIKNRGLAKYSWGTLLMNYRGNNMSSSINTQLGVGGQGNEIGFDPQNIPTFRLLAQKSPNITRYSWGEIRVKEDLQNAKWTMRITNNLTDSYAYCKIAIKNASKAAIKKWYSMVSYINRQKRMSFYKILK